MSEYGSIPACRGVFLLRVAGSPGCSDLCDGARPGPCGQWVLVAGQLGDLAFTLQWARRLLGKPESLYPGVLRWDLDCAPIGCF